MGCIWSAEYHPIKEPQVASHCDINSFRTGSLLYFGDDLSDIRAAGVLVHLGKMLGTGEPLVLEWSNRTSYDWLQGNVATEPGVRLTALSDVVKREPTNKIYYQALTSQAASPSDSEVLTVCRGLQKNLQIRDSDRLSLDFNSTFGHYRPTRQAVARFSHQNLVSRPHTLTDLKACWSDANGIFSKN